ncbi:MAG: hypothetical protein AB3N14_21345 [Flavobacteriaceae bacterium]
MKTHSPSKLTALLVAFFCYSLGFAQIASNVYLHETSIEEGKISHELKIDNGYFIYSKFKKSPAEFISTVGGFYSVENDSIKVKLEFNSNYEDDGVTKMAIPFSTDGTALILNDLKFEAKNMEKQDLDGQWLFATRGPDTGQERRGEAQARKTLKFLLNGHFQWIAYHTETFRFSGSGGGTFTAKDGKYIEHIGYFSRDNSRVGAQLDFNYEVKGDDWHHKGKNSKGAPMYEIWSRRN